MYVTCTSECSWQEEDEIRVSDVQSGSGHQVAWLFWLLPFALFF